MILARLGLAACLLLPFTAEAADWVIAPSKSRIGFSGVQVGAPFSGRFTRFEGQISFDPDKPEAGRAVILIDLASAQTGDAQRDSALPQAEWFDAKTNPKARFEATRFVHKGNDAYEASGTLTIRGIAKDVTLPFRLARDGNIARATGHLDLVRSQFGVGQGAWATGQWVGLEVGVDIDVTATAR